MNTADRDASRTDPPRARRRRFLGEMLVAHGVVTSEQLAQALSRQQSQKGTRLGTLLVTMGLATEVQICEAIAEQLQIPAADLVAVDVSVDVLARVPKELAFKHNCLPWFVEGRDLFLIMADPTDINAADAVAFATGLHVRPVVAPESEVTAVVRRFYAAEETSLAEFEDVDLAEQLSVVSDAEGAAVVEDDALQAAQAAPVVKLVNAMLADAVRCGASDVHVEPQEREVLLRYRVDGLLREVLRMPKRVQNRIVSRVKIMAHMDISERRRPQDGRARIIVGTKSYDLRVSALPTADGEKIVIRVLAQDRAGIALEDLGLEPDDLAGLKAVLRRPQGMILVTGPTGSGKSSTLYAALNFLRSETVNIVTIEDPVEYRLGGISQVAVSEKAGLTFAAGLRSILRQDPDVIMVGEIRDLETAQVAFQAAQTGHLVLSTLHTNDAPSAVTRLVDIGIPAYAVASSVIAVVAQRLARTLCECRTAQPDGTALPRGCEKCRFGGFRGRTALYELMRLTPRVRSVLLGQGTDDALRRAALASGMTTLFADGERKVARGTTTLDEVGRVAPPDDDQGSEERPSGADKMPSPVLSAEAGVARRSRILLVDDDEAFREALRETLESENYDVLAVGRAQDGLAEIFRRAPDLILADLHLPDMDGIELLQRLRSDLSTCRIPVLLLTVIDSDAMEVQALDLGADDYVTKPFERARLLSRIRRALFRTQLQRMGS